MSNYTSQALVGGFISPQNLIALTDDQQSGQFNLIVFEQVATSVSNMIDGMLASIYSVPFSQVNPPTLVQSACTIITCQKLMNRRLVPGEKNPFDKEAEILLGQLEQIARGIGGLDNATSRAFSPGYVEATPSPLGGGAFYGGCR